MIDVKKLAEANDDLERAMAEVVRGVMMQAQITRAKFLALKKTGFTDAQAFELCRSGLA
jgi:AmiR/NasT family two-component response regulator